MSDTYFNDVEPFVCDWLANLWPEAQVDRRSIRDIQPSDLDGFRRAHFFAGIGGWEYALQLAGWPATLPVWTGSCPCQPFSAAGKGKGEADARHLWPEFRRLITECRPPVVFGEQVASRLGREWLAGVRADLEALGYAVGAADLCAAGVGAPHIRQRLYWVAYTASDEQHGAGRIGAGRRAEPANGGGARRLADARGERVRAAGCGADAGAASGMCGANGKRQRLRPDAGADGGGVGSGVADPMLAGWAEGRPIAGNGSAAERGATGGMDDAAGARRDGPLGNTEGEAWDETRLRVPGAASGAGGMGHADQPRSQGRVGGELCQRADQRAAGPHGPCGPAAWSDALWLRCQDGKARRVSPEPEFFPLAHGLPGRVGRLRAYGNAIVPQQAAAFIVAFMESVAVPPARRVA